MAGVMFISPLAVADDDEREALRRLVERGEVVPLMSLISRIQDEYRGEIIEVELEYDDDDDELIYEIDLLTPAGNKIEFEFDARTGEQIKVEGRGLRDARRSES